MKLIGYTCTYNEEKMIPYVMPYVERLGYDKFIVYDNMSTDNTVEELKKYPFVEVRSYEKTHRFIDDDRIQLFYKSIGESKGMIENNEPVWMTWTDFDEVLYVKSFEPRQTLSLWLLHDAYKNGYNVCAPQMVNLLSENFPIKDGFVHENVKKCAIWGIGKKMTLFLVNDIYDIISDYGFHKSYVTLKKPLKDFSDEVNICAFHLKYIDYKHVFEKGKNVNNRFAMIYCDEKKDFEHFIKTVNSESFPIEMYFANKLNSKLNLLSGIEYK